MTRTIKVEKPYIRLPLAFSGEKKIVRYTSQSGELLREYEAILADRPDYELYEDVSAYTGQTILVSCEGWEEELAFSDRVGEIEGEEKRPLLHFTAKQGWLNDPNGLVFADGVYHMFFQHNPYGSAWGNMHWGHATSRDLLRFDETDEALYPDDLGTMFSGSAVADASNTSGLKTGERAPLVLVYTAAGGTLPRSDGKGFTVCLAVSNDGGKTFCKYENNPVVDMIAPGNRDPKVIWHEKTASWIMALYLEEDRFALLTSPNLRDWTEASRFAMDGGYECPDFFPLADSSGRERWVFWEAGGRYLIGEFDGKSFTPDGPVRMLTVKSDKGANAYAAQTFSDAPGGRRLQVFWFTQTIEKAGYSCMLSLPCELTLGRTSGGEPELRIARAAEAEALFDGEVEPGEAEGPVRIRADLRGGLTVYGLPIGYDEESGILSCAYRGEAVASPEVEIWVDRHMVEIFASDGARYIPIGHSFPALAGGICGNCTVTRLKPVYHNEENQ